MKTTYRVIGVKIDGKEMKLVLQRNIIKEKLSATRAIGDLGGFMDQMKMDANATNNPDHIHISTKDYDEMQMALGDLITLEVIK